MMYLRQTTIDLKNLMAEYNFDKWVRERRITLGISQEQLAKSAGTTKQTISSIERQAPHPITESPYRPSMEMVDKIAIALGESKTEARLAAGILPEGYERNYNLEEDRLIRYFTELPRECQLDVLALTEALWRRRRTKQSPPLKDEARKVSKPQEIPKRRAS